MSSCGDCWYAENVAPTGRYVDWDGENCIECRNVRVLIGAGILANDKLYTTLKNQDEPACEHFLKYKKVREI